MKNFIKKLIKNIFYKCYYVAGIGRIDVKHLKECGAKIQESVFFGRWSLCGYRFCVFAYT